MSQMRRRGQSLAAGALLMVLAQFAAVCAAPLAACTVKSIAASGESVDCCPAGSHPPGQCPFHKRGAPSDGCRVMCATQQSTPFIRGLAGVLPPSVVTAPVIRSEPAGHSCQPARIFRSLPPLSPPPKTFA
jgi:hypothetical protein